MSGLSLPVVDGLELEAPVRSLLMPGQPVRDSHARIRRLPRFFYVVDSWEVALQTRLTPHFAMWEFMDVDLYEPAPLRRFPRYVPCAVTSLAAHLEVLRNYIGDAVHIAANGGYRSPSHGKSTPGSPHAWGAAANIYRIAGEYLDERDRIERYTALATTLLPALRARPFGSGPGCVDDHVHLDLGYLTLVPADAPSEAPGVKKREDLPGDLRLAAVGLEAELTLHVDDVPEKPEKIFGTPRAFIRGALQHRVGTSFHLPTGAAVYFDTGVIEVATPIIEIDRGCMARAGRSLWDSIHFIRAELDAWEQRTGRRARLAGFSTHYNVSIDPGSRNTTDLDAFARLLTYVLPAPVMLLAANRKSTGIGVRPRGDRIEITADFTPDPTMMVAAGSLIAGVIRAMARWPAFELDTLRRRGLPRAPGFQPMPHTSRKGWLARFDCYRENPFTEDPDALRQLASGVFDYFRLPIARIADPFSLRLIGAVLSGRARSYLDQDERPAEYDDVGRLRHWAPFYADVLARRSRLEAIVMHALAGDRLHIEGSSYTPTGMQGWSRIVFRRDADGRRRVMPLDDLLDFLPQWGH